MMRQQLQRVLVVLGVVGIGSGLNQAQAGMAQLEAAQNANPALVNQWKFEGADDSGRLADTKGSQNLLRVAGVGGTVDPDGIPGNGDDIVYTPSVNDIIFEPGYDGALSQAYRPAAIPVTVPNVPADPDNGVAGAPGNVVAQSRTGAGLSTAMYHTPTTVTVEAVVKTDSFDSLNRMHYVFQSRMGGSQDRLYYLGQQIPDSSRNGSSSLSAHIGTVGFPSAAAAPKVVQDAQTANWYYVVATYDLTANPAVMNAYSANLTTGGPLVQTVTNATFTIDPASIANAANARPWGVGMFAINAETEPGSGIFATNGGQEFFYGAIDNLALYGSVLSQDQVAANLAALRIPEPGTLALVALTALSAAGCRRRK